MTPENNSQQGAKQDYTKWRFVLPPIDRGASYYHRYEVSICNHLTGFVVMGPTVESLQQIIDALTFYSKHHGN